MTPQPTAVRTVSIRQPLVSETALADGSVINVYQEMTGMDLPEMGARLRAGTNATVRLIERPNAAGNVRCIVEDDHGHLGWIVYYAGGTRSNINFFRDHEQEAIRALLPTAPEDELRQGG